MVRGLNTPALQSPVNVVTMRLQELESDLDITPRRSEHPTFFTAAVRHFKVEYIIQWWLTGRKLPQRPTTTLKVSL